MDKMMTGRFQLVPVAWLSLLTAAVVAFACSNLGLGAWAFTLCLLLLALFLVIPALGFIVERNLPIRLFASVTGQTLAGVDWNGLPSVRRSIVFFCTLLCFANGLLLLWLALSRLLWGG